MLYCYKDFCIKSFSYVGEPNSAGDEDCIEIVQATGRWNDNRCNSVRNFICKRVGKCKSCNHIYITLAQCTSQQPYFGSPAFFTSF